MVDNIVKDFGNLTLAELYKCKKEEHRVYTCSLDINDYVKCYDEFVTNTDFNIETLTSELKNLKSQLRESTSLGVQNLWLSNTNRPYSWKSKSGTVNNPPIAITGFPEINSMLEKLNKDISLDLNSCLFSYYKDREACTSLHNDNEPEMDPNQPICVVSFGATRRVDFLNTCQIQSETPLLTIDPKDSSLYMMKQGCQQFFKHRAKRNIKIKEERYSLSFRRIVPFNEEQRPPVTFSPVKAAVTNFEKLNDTSKSCGNTQQATSPPPERKSTLTLPTPVPKSSTKTAVILVLR